MGEPRPLSRGERLARVVVLVVLWTAWLVVATAYLVLTGVAGESGAWRWAAFAYLPLAFPTWGLVRRFRHRRVVTAVAVGVIGLLVWGVPAQATPGFERVDAFADEWGGPRGARLLGETSEGNDLCFQDRCPTIVRYYAVPDAAATVAALDTRLERDGWERRGLGEGPAWCRGDFHVSAWKPPSSWVPVELGVAAPRDGLEVVELRFGANCL